MYAVDDEFGNTITSGSYEDCLAAARCYLSAHKDAPCVEIYDVADHSCSDTLDRQTVLECE